MTADNTTTNDKAAEELAKLLKRRKFAQPVIALYQKYISYFDQRTSTNV